MSDARRGKPDRVRVVKRVRGVTWRCSTMDGGLGLGIGVVEVEAKVPETDLLLLRRPRPLGGTIRDSSTDRSQKVETPCRPLRFREETRAGTWGQRSH